MKYILLNFLLFSLTAFCQQPIYVQVSFNGNYFPTPGDADTNVVNIKRHIALMERYGWKADYFFTWLTAKQLNINDPNIFSFMRSKGLRLHHHGANRPPDPNPIARVAGKSWDEAVRIIRDYETHDIDSKTGQLLMNIPGGREELIKMFQDSMLSDGRMLRAPIYYIEKVLGAKMGVGIQSNLNAEKSDVWFMGMMNRPETVSLDPGVWNNREPNQIAAFMDSIVQTLDRNTFQMIALLIHDSDFLLRPISTDVQTKPLAPYNMREQTWKRYQAILEWCKSRSDVQVMTIPGILNNVEQDIKREFRQSMIDHVVRTLTDKEPMTAVPLYFSYQNDFASVTDALQMLYYSLSEYQQTKQLPSSVQVNDVLAQTELQQSNLPPYSPTGLPEITSFDILSSLSQIQNFSSGFIPPLISIGNQKLNPAEFLHTLALLYRNIQSGDTSATMKLYRINVVQSEIMSNTAIPDMITKLQFWTYKSVRWKFKMTEIKNSEEIIQPDKIILQQNFPNPFTGSTAIGYRLSVSGNVRLEVFDLLGRKVATLIDEEQEAEVKQVEVKSKEMNLNNGIYFYQLEANGQTLRKKMIVLQ